MPASYAHYRFGKLCVPELPANVRQPIQRFRQLYNMGLQGPNIFFYHNPFGGNAVSGLTAKFHAQSGQEFFTNACAQATTEAGLAYLYGLLGHYCLDSVAHPYIRKHSDSGEVRHGEMEAEFDRLLLELDGMVPPHMQDFSGYMKLTRGECVTVASFFPPATPADINRSVRNMALAHRTLSGRSRKGVEGILRLTGKDLLETRIPETPNDRCTHINRGLLVMFDRAVKRYPELMEGLTAYMTYGEPLGEAFASDFG